MTSKVPHKKVRRRSKRFKTGTHTSLKSQLLMNFRSSWELEFMLYLDTREDVVAYSYESVIIPYIKSARSKRVSKYIVDFKIEYSDGRTELIEIKSSSFVARKINVIKFAAAKAYCLRLGWTFSVKTEKDLRLLGLLKRTGKKD